MLRGTVLSQLTNDKKEHDRHAASTGVGGLTRTPDGARTGPGTDAGRRRDDGPPSTELTPVYEGRGRA